MRIPANIHMEEAIGRGRGETVRRRQEGVLPNIHNTWRLFVRRPFVGRRPFVEREAVCRERPFVEKGRFSRGCLLREEAVEVRPFVEGCSS